MHQEHMNGALKCTNKHEIISKYFILSMIYWRERRCEKSGVKRVRGIMQGERERGKGSEMEKR